MRKAIEFGFVLTLSIGAFIDAARAQEPSFSSPAYFTPAHRAQQIEFEKFLNGVPMRESLRALHDQFGSEPHIAGTAGDERNIKRLAVSFRALGMEVQVHEFWAYLAKPIDATVQVLGKTDADTITLPLKEAVLPEDKSSKDPDLTIGFNAYSGSGDVTGEVVYANYGTKSDFEKLKELGVDCAGKIVIARYGGNFRGYKAKFAQQAGAAALIIYTDPDDSGYRKGVTYPEGGWANETAIQRGSLITLDYPGDPLTPGAPATEHAARLDPDKVDLPRIPVQPMGYGAAREIITRMKGRALPPELVKDWQGGLPCAYRLEGGPDLRVRVMVKQERVITKTANVIATLPGQIHPDEKIIIGCHHDAWCHGAGDPLAGLILVYETARSFFQAGHVGYSPSRSIVFAAWGAEEYGIVGSTEYCEQYADDLMKSAVAYINLDAATMGPNFGASAAPSLKRLIEEVSRDVPQARAADSRSIRQTWGVDANEPPFGNLGGGSDHVGFYCHLGIPSCGVSAGGSQGSAYHSNYDNLHWYRQVVGDDYEPAIMLTRVVNLLALRLANANVLPLDPVRYGTDGKVHLESLRKRAEELKIDVDFAALAQRIDRYETSARQTMQRVEQALDAEKLDWPEWGSINRELLAMESDWLIVPGDGKSTATDAVAPALEWSRYRPWFRSLWAASDPESGYAAWMWPALRLAIEQKSPAPIQQAVSAYGSVFDRLQARIEAIDSVLTRAAELEVHP